jgi:hypothetical protein
VIDKHPFVWYIITMKATKEHFEFTAALINAANNGTPAFVLATLAAAEFAKGNPRFDADRFKAACGVDPLTDTVACLSDTGTASWLVDGQPASVLERN